MSSLIKHAEREFAIIEKRDSEKNKDKPANKTADEMWNMMKANVIELLAVLEKQGHSGHSIGYVLNMFNKLAKYEPISPITGDDDEWTKIGENKWQNMRNSKIFKQINSEGYPYCTYNDAITLVDETGGTWGGSAKLATGATVGSQDYAIKGFPFNPKTFYINVKEILNDEGDFVGFKVIDESQLQAVDIFYTRIS